MQNSHEIEVRIKWMLWTCHPTLVDLLKYTVRTLDERFPPNVVLARLLNERYSAVSNVKDCSYSMCLGKDDVDISALSIPQICGLLLCKPLELLKTMVCCPGCNHECKYCQPSNMATTHEETTACLKTPCLQCGSDATECEQQRILHLAGLLSNLYEVNKNCTRNKYDDFDRTGSDCTLPGFPLCKSWPTLWRKIHRAITFCLTFLNKKGCVTDDVWKDRHMDLRIALKKSKDEIVYLFNSKAIVNLSNSSQNESGRQQQQQLLQFLQQLRQQQLEQLLQQLQQQLAEQQQEQRFQQQQQRVQQQQQQQQQNQPEHPNHNHHRHQEQQRYHDYSQQYHPSYQEHHLPQSQPPNVSYVTPNGRDFTSAPSNYHLPNSMYASHQSHQKSYESANTLMELNSPSPPPLAHAREGDLLRINSPSPPPEHLRVERFRTPSPTQSTSRMRVEPRANTPSPLSSAINVDQSTSESNQQLLGATAADYHSDDSSSTSSSRFGFSIAQENEDSCVCMEYAMTTALHSTFTSIPDRASLTAGSTNIQSQMSSIIPEQPRKKIVLIRGLPGSGKTTRANSYVNNGGVVLSTDNYFMEGGVFDFKPDKLTDAHQWNQNKAKEEMEKETTPICIDNTNVKAWEMKPYVDLADQYGYEVEIVEVNTEWAFKPKELAQKTSKNVSKSKIEAMKKKFDKNVTVDAIRRSKMPERK